MKTKSLRSAISILLAVIMLMSIAPIAAMAATYDSDGYITSTGFTLYNFAYGSTVMSAKAGGELGIAFVESTTFYESEKAIPTSREDLVETADGYFQAGKQYFCAIEFTEHEDLFLDSENPHYFARELTATLTCNDVSCEQVLDLSENRRVFVYKLPVLTATPYGIDVTVAVEQGGNIAPTTGAFELEVLNTEKASNLPIDSFTIGNTTISTEGTGNFDSKLTIGHDDYEKLFYLFYYEGIFVRQKIGTAEGWTYDESVWLVQFHQDPVVNALDDSVEVMPKIRFDCLKGKLVDDEFVPETEIPADKITFTNIYTENEDPIVTVKIPFVKKVTLGGNIAPTDGTFQLEIFDIGNGNKEEYADVTYSAQVKVTGEGEFDGELIITGPEGQVDQMICEGFYVREIDGKAENWKYSEDVWHIVPESIPVEKDEIQITPNLPAGSINQGQIEQEMVDVLSIYPTSKVVDGEDVYYEDGAETAQKMIFENIYTENKETVVTVKIPFVKKVTLGGDIAPTNETFQFEIFDIGNGNKEEYADVTYSAQVKVTGEGEFKGELIITGPEGQVDQMICEGFLIREVKGNAANWTYSDAVWCVIPEWNEKQEQVFNAYPTTKESGDNGDYYEIAEKPAEIMIFENIYTESKPAEAPQTGDTGMMGLWIALMLMSGLGIAAITVMEKKRFVK